MSIKNWVSKNIIDIGGGDSPIPSEVVTPRETYTEEIPAVTTTLVADTSKFQEFFDTLMSEINLPGPDYFEFKKMVIELSKTVSIDKAISIAYSTMVSTGLTKESLISSAKHYLNGIQANDVEYKKAIDQKLNVDIKSKEDLVVCNSNKIQENNITIASLQTEIAKLQGENVALNGEIATDKSQLELNVTNYNQVKVIVENQINQDIINIEQFIK